MMKLKKIPLAFFVLSGFGLLVWHQIGTAERVAAIPELVAAIPELVVTDANGIVLGGFSTGSGAGSVAVLMRDTVNDQNYHILVGANRLRGFNTSDVWYQFANCTGTAYVLAPSELGRTTAALRGATYAIGKKSGATHEDSVVMRGTGPGSNQDSNIRGRFRTNTLSAPTCTKNRPAAPVVVATQIDDLSALVRPFKVD